MNKSIIGKVNAIAIYITWSFLALMILGMLSLLLKSKSAAILFPIGLGGMLLFGLIHFVLSFFVRCPICNKGLTSQGFNKPKQEHGKILNSWSYVAVKWFTGTVTCIHCGGKVNTNKL